MNRLMYIALLVAAPVVMLAGDPSASLVAPANDHGGTLRWIRRATLGGSCVAGTVVNNWALHQVASQPNVQLSGPFFSNGKPQYGALVGIGAGTCAFSVFLQETHLFGNHTRRTDLVDTFANGASAGLSVWETMKFLSLRDQARAAQHGVPGTLSSPSIH